MKVISVERAEGGSGEEQGRDWEVQGLIDHWGRNYGRLQSEFEQSFEIYEAGVKAKDEHVRAVNFWVIWVQIVQDAKKNVMFSVDFTVIDAYIVRSNNCMRKLRPGR